MNRLSLSSPGLQFVCVTTQGLTVVGQEKKPKNFQMFYFLFSRYISYIYFTKMLFLRDRFFCMNKETSKRVTEDLYENLTFHTL